MTERPSVAQTTDLVRSLVEGLGLDMDRTVRMVIEPHTVTAVVLKADRPKGQFLTEDHTFFFRSIK